MIGGDNSHPDVFVPAVPLPDEGERIIYPPRPDSDGRYDLLEVLDWDRLMRAVYARTELVCAFFRSELGSMTPETATKVEGRIRQIERIRPLFLRRELFLIPEQQRYKDVFALLVAEAMVWAGYTDTIKMFANVIVGSPSKWLPLSQALVENNLNRQQDWRQARSPAKWVKQVTNSIVEKHSLTQNYAIDYTREPEMISVEELIESPIEGLVEKKYTSISLSALEAAAAEDPETAAYVACKIRNPSWPCERITQHLRWDEKRGKRVDRRYRRMRHRLRECGFGIPSREYRPPSGISDANFTSYFEPLYDGSHGRGVGVWQHRDRQS